MNTWIVQTPTGPDGQWQAVETTTRFVQAARTYLGIDGTRKRLLRNGKALRIQTTSEQLDVFEEDTA